MILLRVFAPFALGYYLSYLYRTVNAVIADGLVRDLGLDAATLGLLTSIYFWTFAAFQLPLGILLDRYGPRRTEAALQVFAAVGAFVFSIADGVGGLILGRALIGFGVSACLMAAFKAFVMWFPRERLPMVNGLQMACGIAGYLTATKPIAFALDFTDWRGIFLILAVITLASALAVFLVVPKRQEKDPPAAPGTQIAGVVQIFTSPVFWRLVPLTFMAQASFLSVQGLWAAPWLRDVGGLPWNEVENQLTWIAVATLVGSIAIGTMADRLSRRGIPLQTIAVSLLVLFMGIQALIVFGWMGAVLPMWMAFGFVGTSGILSYAVLSQSFAAELAGRVNTALNLLVFLASGAAQWGMGLVIDLWPPTASGGYPTVAYQAAFGMMLGLQVLGLIWFLIYRGASRG